MSYSYCCSAQPWRDSLCGGVRGASVAPRFYRAEHTKTLITTRSDDYIAVCTVYWDCTKNERSAALQNCFFQYLVIFRYRAPFLVVSWYRANSHEECTRTYNSYLYVVPEEEHPTPHQALSCIQIVAPTESHTERPLSSSHPDRSLRGAGLVTIHLVWYVVCYSSTSTGLCFCFFRFLLVPDHVIF